MKKSTVPSQCVLAVASCLLLAGGVTPGCSNTPVNDPVKAKPKAPPAKPKPPAEPLEVGAPRLCVGHKALAKLVAEGPLPAIDPAIQPGVMVASTAGAKADPEFEKAYRAVAPATVFIQTQRGSMGTGVVVDPAGLVLTNYHVVDGGKQDDFSLKVRVFFGKMTPTGRMIRDEKGYEGIVHKADPVRDIALIKVKDPPKDLPSAKLAPKDPKTGQPVAAIGHASIGMLWAMKGCQVAAIGDKAVDRSGFQFDCSQLSNPNGDEEDNERLRKRCTEEIEEAKREVSSHQQGLMVQTDCLVAGGDSGGPVINAKGEIIAINQSMNTDPRTQSTVGYHVHVAELREFVAEVPSGPAYVPPDPWCDGGLDGKFEDIDLDGQVDLARVSGYRRTALFFDLDEDSFKKKISPEGTVGKMPFDAEVAWLSQPQGAYVWYDTTGDGRFDLMLVDSQDEGRPVKAYTIAADGTLSPTELKSRHYIDAAHFSDAAMKGRLGRITQVIGTGLTSPETLASAADPTPPDPIWGAGKQGKLEDADLDGKPDLLKIDTPFSAGWLVDADQDSVGGLQIGDDAQALMNSRKIDPEISIISQRNSYWVLYDSDNNGEFDLALLKPPGYRGYITARAWKRVAGAWQPAPEQEGLKTLRPGLLNLPRAVEIAKHRWGIFAVDEGLSALPSPTPDGYYRLISTPDVKKNVVHVTYRDGTVLLLDVDRDSKTEGTTVRASVDNGSFRADVAVISSAPSMWVFYDTDDDRTWDLILFSKEADNGLTSSAFRLVNGRLQYDAQAASGRLLRHKKIFQDDRKGEAFAKLAQKLFQASFIEED